ncbi:hypothetical protein BSM4216_1318 [Bacillus smithii]|nr:hypothetical protein BSM4216_1318 [Bacillus smithii]
MLAIFVFFWHPISLGVPFSFGYFLLLHIVEEGDLCFLLKR